MEKDTACPNQLQPTTPQGMAKPLGHAGGLPWHNKFEEGKKILNREGKREQKRVRNSRGNSKVRGEGGEEVLQASDQRFPAAHGRNHAEQREDVRKKEQQRETFAY